MVHVSRRGKNIVFVVISVCDCCGVVIAKSFAAKNNRVVAWNEGYSLIDLHNSADFMVGFTDKYFGYAVLSRARNLGAFILRDSQV
jgi:hypothetical protein